MGLVEKEGMEVRCCRSRRYRKFVTRVKIQRDAEILSFREWENEWWHRKIVQARSWPREKDNGLSFRCTEFEALLVCQ